MSVNNEGNRLELSGNSEDIRKFIAELKRMHFNISRMSGSYTSNLSNGEGGLEVSFTCRTEDGEIEAIYREKTPSCASVEEAEEMRIFKKMTLRVPQAVFDKGEHQDILDLAKKWLGNMGVDVELVVTGKIEME
ncbi:MAG TPA: hypothetical protein VGK23_04810 [Methanomassiliicoccales archaeon]|jgi:hypothetical protein